MYTSDDVEAYFGSEPPELLLDLEGSEAEKVAEEYCDNFPQMFGVSATERDRAMVLEILKDCEERRSAEWENS